MASSQTQPAGIGEVAVVGLGIMGAGIAEVLARSGHDVVAIEANHTALARGLAALHASLDKAMLGCGYPRGPLEMLDDTGPAAVLGVLSAMYASSADPAFAPVPLLAEHAAAGTRFRG